MGKIDPYKSSGVDTELADSLVDWLKDEKTPSKSPLGHIVSGIGPFAGIFKCNFEGIKKPLLISSTDGVGTKLLLGLENDRLDPLGIDLVAMCINDLYTTGAHPLFFLDYYASGKLSKDQFKEVLSSIKKGLEIASCPLMGGETAELPGLYQGSHFDLAGFVVGVVDEENLINPSLVKKTDILYALPSSGFHSNGYSLLRKWLKDKPALHTKENLDFLLTPTRIYPEILTLLKKLPRNTIHGIAHITGGGISGNLPRVLPKDLDAAIKLNDLPTPPIMKKFIEGAGFSVADVEPTFNLGCGMILSVASENIMAFEKESDALQLSAKRIGYLKENLNSGEAKVIYE